jgi:GntR family transcriptional regulator
MKAYLARAPDLSPLGGTPAHVRIEHWLTAGIEAGKLHAGDKLPNEQELAGLLRVSRMTLRQALGSLESRGVVERIPGRQGGTFIREPRIESDITGVAGFTEQLRRGQVRVSARLVSTGIVPASRHVAHALELERAADVYEIVRVRTARSRPLALERSYLPVEIFPGLLDQRMSGSLYSRLRRRYHEGPQMAVEYLEPFIATPEIAQLLEVEVGSALLLIERIASSASGRPIEYARDLFRPDRIRISVRTIAGTSGVLRSTRHAADVEEAPVGRQPT